MGGSLDGRTIALLEARRRDEMAALVRARGGSPMVAPCLRETTAAGAPLAQAAVAGVVRRPFDAAVFQTGVGVGALFEAAEAARCQDVLRERLAGAVVVARGPKPLAVLHRQGVRVDRRTVEPHTTAEVLGLLEADLAGRLVLVLEHGAENAQLREALRGRGAEVLQLSTYAWDLPLDLDPIRRLLSALRSGEVDAVLVTSASQVDNLFLVAAMEGDPHGSELIDLLNARTLVAAVGPVSAAAVRERGVAVRVEPGRPKMVPLIDAVCAHFDRVRA